VFLAVGVDVVGPHEVMHHQLRPTVEEIEQADLSVRAHEHVRLDDPDHRQASAVGVDPVAQPDEFLLLGQELFAGREPLSRRHHLRQVLHRHRYPPRSSSSQFKRPTSARSPTQ